jgi:tRNA(fMet)-specific endonuclease VapC
MMRRVQLDTNIVSHFLTGHPNVVRLLVATPMARLCISAITEGELRFGVAKQPRARRIRATVEGFLLRIDVLPWTRATAVIYGALRADMTRRGKALGPLDMLIAAHALEANAILATNDAAFGRVPGLNVVDWTRGDP